MRFTLSILFLALTLGSGAQATDLTPSQKAALLALGTSNGGPVSDLLGQSINLSVCCQLAEACSPGPEGSTSAETRSLCIAANGQPLTGQVCHSDGQCRP